MKIWTEAKPFEPSGGLVLTVGTFDGVHLGHRKILNRLVEIARGEALPSGVLTFHPHPRSILFPQEQALLKLLNSPDEKAALLEEAGIDHLIIQPFTPVFAGQTYTEFVRNILVEGLQVSVVVVGYDHHFGKNREGGFRELHELGRQYGFRVEEIPEQDVRDAAVSSSRIRLALSQGDIMLANEMLGYSFPLEGEVVRGQGMGVELGFRTANLKISTSDKQIPADGVYLVYVEHPHFMGPGMMNIGFRPTFEGKERSIEVHLIGFEGDLYGNNLKVRCIDYLRGEFRFPNKESLIAQLMNDRQLALERFRKLNV